jgi:hypothetical protein
MKALVISACMLFSVAAVAQSADAVNYAPRPILLMGSSASEEGVMPMLVTADGVQRLEFVPISRIKEYASHGAQAIRLGDVLSALGDATQTINKLEAENVRLQTENDRLWKVAMKDNPQAQPPTVVVQQPAPAPQDNRLARYMLLRSLLQSPQPYQLPMPVNPNANRLKTNCTSSTLGTTTTTDCH